RAADQGLYHRPLRLIGANMQQAREHTLKAFDEDLDRLRALISEMGGLAEYSIGEAMRCLVERDISGAEQVIRDDKKLDALEMETEAAYRGCERDDAVDNFYDSIFRTLLTHMMENPQNIGHAAHLLFIAKNLERVGDHATNIAEMVYYAATGEHMADRPGKSPK